MKILKTLLFVIAGMLSFSIGTAHAQCAMCTASVEANAKNGGTAAMGLNHGIMYLLAAPYIAIGVVAYIWYKKYRRKNINLNMRDEKLHLN